MDIEKKTSGVALTEQDGGLPQERNEQIQNANLSETASESLPAREKRLTSVELCRIVCMAMVIFNHTLNQFYGLDGVGGYLAKYLNFVNICAVGTFLIISGFFMFQGGFSYRRRLNKLLTEIWIPTLAVMVFILLSKSFFSMRGGADFFAEMRRFAYELVKDLLAWQVKGSFGYLWFVLAYTEIVVLYPIWFLLCKQDRANSIARRCVVALLLARLFFENLAHAAASPFLIRIFSLINVNMAFVLIGYELRLLYDGKRIVGKKARAYGAAAYLAGVIFGMALMSVENFVFHAFSWYWYYLTTIPAIVSAVGLFVFFININIKGNAFLYTVAASGMFVYLVQSPFHEILAGVRLFDRLYPPLGLGAIFVIGLLCAAASFAVGVGISAAIRRVREKNKLRRRADRSAEKHI